MNKSLARKLAMGRAANTSGPPSRVIHAGSLPSQIVRASEGPTRGGIIHPAATQTYFKFNHRIVFFQQMHRWTHETNSLDRSALTGLESVARFHQLPRQDSLLSKRDLVEWRKVIVLLGAFQPVAKPHNQVLAAPKLGHILQASHMN